MNITDIGDKHGIRVLLNNKPLTKRVKVKVLSSQGITVKQYVNNAMKAFAISQCTVEVTHVNGSSFKYPSDFDYSLPVATDQLHNGGNETLPDFDKQGVPEEENAIGYNGLLAVHYQKWYDEEVEKNNKLRGELEATRKALNTTKNDLELLTFRTNLEYMRKDIEREREAKSGMNGIVDVLNDNVFLQELLTKIVENITNPNNGGLNGIPEPKDPAQQKAFIETINALAKTTGDDEHFRLSAFIVNKVTADKVFAKQVFDGLEKPSSPPEQKLPTITDCL